MFQTLNSKKNFLIITALVIVGLFFIFLRVYDQNEYQRSPGAGSVEVFEEEDDTPPLPEGKDTYFISSGEEGPQLYEATIDPLGSAEPGVQQEISVKARNETPIQSISVTMILDNGTYAVPLELVEGTEFDGIWTGSWGVQDTHESIYQAAIEAKSEEKTSRIVLTFQPTD